MSRLLMSNSQVQAICRNRNEQKNLSDKLDHLDHIAFQSKDSIQQDLKTWRKFRRENVRNTGWSPKSIRPEPGEDVFFDSSSHGRSSSTPNSPTQGKDTFTKPWAYTYSHSSHNKVYKELAQVSKSSQKALDLSLKSKSLDSSVEDDQPAMIKQVTAFQTVNRAASALTLAKNKLLSSRQNEEPKLSGKSTHEKEMSSNGTTNASIMASNVSTLQSVNKFSTVCMLKKKISSTTVEESPAAKPSPTSKLIKSVSAMKGLAKSKEAFTCFKCGQNVKSFDKEERLPKVALAYKGLHRAQSILKLSTAQTASEVEEKIEEKPRVRKCCVNCQRKREPLSKVWKSSKEKVGNSSQNKNSMEKPLLTPVVENNKKPGKFYRKLSSLSNLSEEQEHRLQVAKEKVSKCFEISSNEVVTDGVGSMEKDDVVLETKKDSPGCDALNQISNLKIGDKKQLPDIDKNKSKGLNANYSECKNVKSNEEANCISETDNSVKNLESKFSDQSKNKKGFMNSESMTKSKKQSQHNLRKTEENCKQTDKNSSDTIGSDKSGECTTIKNSDDGEKECTDLEEYPSDITQQTVMKLIQEEVIDKLEKLKTKKKSPTFVRKFSTVSRVSTIFRAGAHRKRKMTKTSGIDVFTRIAKYMLFEARRRRKERERNMIAQQINQHTRKNSQVKFREKFLSLSRQTRSVEATEETIEVTGAYASPLQKTAPTSNERSGSRRMALTSASVDDLKSKFSNEKNQDTQISNALDNHQFCDEGKLSNLTQPNLNNQNIYTRSHKQHQFGSNCGYTKTVTEINDNINNNNYDSHIKAVLSTGYEKKSHDKKDNDNNNSYDITDNTNTMDDQFTEHGPSTSFTIPHSTHNRRKPHWLAGNDPFQNQLYPAIYHKGVRLSNYVTPEKRYLTMNRRNGKKESSVRWHSAVGAMVNKHEIGQGPMLAEKTFPKQSRHRALHNMIQANHTPPSDDTSKVQNQILDSRIRDFLHSVEPYKQK